MRLRGAAGALGVDDFLEDQVQVVKELRRGRVVPVEGPAQEQVLEHQPAQEPLVHGDDPAGPGVAGGIGEIQQDRPEIVQVVGQDRLERGCREHQRGDGRNGRSG